MTTVICLDDYHSLDRYGRKDAVRLGFNKITLCFRFLARCCRVVAGYWHLLRLDTSDW